MSSPRKSPRIARHSVATVPCGIPRPVKKGALASLATIPDFDPASTGETGTGNEPKPTSIKPSKPRNLKRSHSVGGSELQKVVEERRDHTVGATGNRKPLLPRKSSIRAAPPQQFASPSTLAFPEQGRFNFGDAAGESIASRLSSHPSGSVSRTETSSAVTEEGAVQKRQRRSTVAFAKLQETTYFVKDDPTTHVLPASGDVGAELMDTTATSSSSGDSTGEDWSIETHLRQNGLDEDLADRNDDEDDSREVDKSLTAISHTASPSPSDGEDQQTMDMDIDESMAPPSTHARQSLSFGSNRSRMTDGGADDEDEGSEDDESADEEDRSVPMDMTEAHGGSPKFRSRRSSTRMPRRCVATNEASFESGSSDMDLDTTNLSAATGNLARSARSSLSARRSLPRSEADMSQRTDDRSMDMDMTHATGRIVFGAGGADQSEMDDSTASESSESEESNQADQDQTENVTMAFTVALGRIGSVNGQPVPTSPVPAARPSFGSPRRGHEHCGKPAAESPKVLTPTQKAAAAAASARQSWRAVPTSAKKEEPSSPVARSAMMSPLRRMQPIPLSNPSPLRSPARRIQIPVDPSEVQQSPLRAARMSSARRQSLAGPLSLNAPVTSDNGDLEAGQPSFLDGQRSNFVTAVLPHVNEDSFTSFRSASPRKARLSGEQDDISGDEDDKDESTAAELEAMPLRLEDFLPYAGIRFHQDLGAKKRKIAAPVTETDAQGRGIARGSDAGSRGNKGEGNSKRTISDVRLVKYACGSARTIDYLAAACKTLQESVEQSDRMVRDAEDKFYKKQPTYVQELMHIDNDEDRKSLQTQFAMQKQGARAVNQELIYRWRLDNEFPDELMNTLEKNKMELEADLDRVRIAAEALSDQLLPILRTRHSELRQELEREREHQQAVEACDPETLDNLHSDIVEQGAFLAEKKAACDAEQQTLQRLTKDVKTEEVKKAEITAALNKARGTCEMILGCTKEEAMRLEVEIRNLEGLHLWHLQRASLERLIMVHDQSVVVDLGLDPLGNGVRQVKVELAGHIAKDDITVFALEAVREAIAPLVDEGRSAMVIVRQIASIWTAHRHLDSEIQRLQSHFPSSIELIRTPAAGASAGSLELAVTAEVLLARKRAKVRVLARCDTTCLQGAALEMGQTHFDPERVQVQLVYGSADAVSMQAEIADHLANAKTMGNLAFACREAARTVLIDA